jgi:hypothetical protein
LKAAERLMRDGYEPFGQRRAHRSLSGFVFLDRHRVAEWGRRHYLRSERDASFASRGDQAYPAAMGFTVGIFLTAALAAITGFALLPMLTTFVTFSLAIGLVLLPAGAGMTQSWQTPMFTAIAAFLCFLLALTNQTSYDIRQF